VTIRRFSDLTEREILAAISSEEEDGRIYADFAEGLRDDYPASAHIFTDMAAEESEHRRQLIQKIRRSHSARSPAGCPRLGSAPADLAVAAAGN
jgi:erythrin-vacuolar iron transport family protein